MTTDRLFVIMLVMLIPMTGCFGAVDNADAQDDSAETTGETIVNNYYYNNTTTTVIEETEYFTNGGKINANTPYSEITNISSGGFMFPTQEEYHQDFFPYNFSTSVGEAVQIHYFDVIGATIYLDTECIDSSSFAYGENGINQGNFIGGSHTNCTHSVTITEIDYNYEPSNSPTLDYSHISYSLIYSIESVTVV